jgi:hypothetical protein
VITDGVEPSVHVEYKSSHVKQYFKEQRALRTETTIKNPKDFYINKAVPNLSHLRDLGDQVNRKLLEVELRPATTASQGPHPQDSSDASLYSDHLRSQVAFFYAKLYLRILRPNWAALLPADDAVPHSLRTALDRLDAEIHKLYEEATLAA